MKSLKRFNRKEVKNTNALKGGNSGRNFIRLLDPNIDLSSDSAIRTQY